MIDPLVALRLQLEWGADEALGDEPVDRFAAPQPPPRPAPARPVAAAAVRAAPRAETIDALWEELRAFEGCGLRATATNTVHPEGSPAARLVVVGEAPGSDDDRSGRAFSGEAGRRLRRVLASAGFEPDEMLLTTLVPWRPPGNRPPSEAEIGACMPFLHRLLALVRPRHVLLLGAAPVRALTGQAESPRRLRGRTLQVQVSGEDQPIPAIAFPVIEQWFRSAATKQELWSDVLRLRRIATTG